MLIIGQHRSIESESPHRHPALIEELREWRKSVESGKSVGLVPTMGALHRGHLSLIQKARQQCDFVALTIFVNPTQFAPGEDLETYPRTLESDLELARSEGVDVVWLGNKEDLYPQGFATEVRVPDLADRLCGKSRPQHFGGVCLIVLKLLQLFQPMRAYFGEKDLQQVIIIERMVQDLHIETEIVRCALIREADGLALSSRNIRLTAEDRTVALSLSKALSAVHDAWQQGERNSEILRGLTHSLLAPQVVLEYLELVDLADLSPLHHEEIGREIAVCLAAKVGEVRLIDNVILELGR